VRNISTIYRTAVTELDRKNTEIKGLRAQLEQLQQQHPPPTVRPELPVPPLPPPPPAAPLKPTQPDVPQHTHKPQQPEQRAWSPGARYEQLSQWGGLQGSLPLTDSEAGHRRHSSRDVEGVRQENRSRDASSRGPDSKREGPGRDDGHSRRESSRSGKECEWPREQWRDGGRRADKIRDRGTGKDGRERDRDRDRDRFRLPSDMERHRGRSR